jgi:hypothetical protein
MTGHFAMPIAPSEPQRVFAVPCLQHCITVLAQGDAANPKARWFGEPVHAITDGIWDGKIAGADSGFIG